MSGSEIDAVRALLGAKPRPVGWAERRARIEEVGAADPVASDVKLSAVDIDGERCAKRVRMANRRGRDGPRRRG